ncbi:MAG TPA: UrcA family protein [Caulobacterales bacterium]|nr:UrcA family protein [Caulobacterales bacterium]
MRIEFLTVVLAAAALTSPALAQPGREAVRVSVSYADLDVSTPTGARELAHRIDDAAARACGGSPGFDVDYRLAPAAVTDAFETCKSEAVARTLSALNRPSVTRAYAENFASRRSL